MSCKVNLNLEKKNYAKECFSLGSSHKIKIILTDCEERISPNLLELNITDPDGNVFLGNPIEVEEGFYYHEQNFTLKGEWIFSWSAEINNEIKIYNKIINVLDESKIEENKFGLDFNELITVEVFKGIKSADNKEMLDSEIFSFSSEYNPFYCSTEMLRMEMGSWVDIVPDDSIALAIHWSSIEADNITSKGVISEEYYYARTRYVMYDAAVKLFSMPISNDKNTGKTKQLGDLLIEEGASISYPLKDLINELKEERDEWWRVVNARGSIVLGQGLGPSSALKGSKGKLERSREWYNPLEEYYIQPTQNSLYKSPNSNKYKHGFTNEARYSNFGFRRKI